jgi:hypothetical protein
MKVDRETAVEETFRPEWARIKEAAARIGLKQTRMYELLEESNGAIRNFVLRSPRAERGPRLVYMPSVFEYLNRVCQEQEEKE